ncbi:ATP-binding cassette domain-containing protein [Treponema pedis]|uniref:ATP-binding cassette domain-containing protein n=1 Tax=Treponema pedis TaxID=409322 RepID=UPI002091DF88|nr:ATP-binding cassette domain-containing protein [Treponema pedis]
MSTPILSIEKLNKTFLHGKVQALKNCSLNVSKNSITGLLGMNGAGKTTLIKCVANLLIPCSGNIYFENENPLKKTEIVTNNISVLLDGGRNLFWYMTVEEKYKNIFHC